MNLRVEYDPGDTTERGSDAEPRPTFEQRIVGHLLGPDLDSIALFLELPFGGPGAQPDVMCDRRDKENPEQRRSGDLQGLAGLFCLDGVNVIHAWHPFHEIQASCATRAALLW